MANSLFDEVRQYLIDTIPDYVGTHSYGCDLGWTLTERLKDGSGYFGNPREALDFMFENRFDVQDVTEELKFSFGSLDDAFGNTHPFVDPDNYLCICMIDCARLLISMAINDDDVFGDGGDWWNEDQEFTQTRADKFIKYLKDGMGTNPYK